MYLSAKCGLPAPITSRAHINLGVERAVWPERHVPGDEHEIARRHRGVVARGRDRLAGQGELIDLMILVWNHSNHRGMDIGARRKAALHDDRGARRYVAPEFCKARQV